jgi:hypothetical protein
MLDLIQPKRRNNKCRIVFIELEEFLLKSSPSEEIVFFIDEFDIEAWMFWTMPINKF